MKKPSPVQTNIRAQVALFTTVRLAINSAYRMAYAMQPLLAAGMGVKLSELAVALSIRSLLGSFAPFLAIFTDTHGRKKGMMFGLVLFVLGVGLTATLQSFIGFIIGSSLVVVGNGVFIPSMQSYLSDHVPFERRGKYFAITELSWSLAFIIGAPALGLLLTHINWVAPHVVLTGIGLILLLLFWKLVPEDFQPQVRQPVFQNLGVVLRTVPVMAGIAASTSFICANELVNVVFGEWIKDSFGLAFATLTVAAIVIGGSELGSELLSAFFLDRIGKQKAMTIGLLVNALAAILMPLTKNSLPLTLAALALFFVSFEFTFLSLVTQMSEIVPNARATVMALLVSTFSLGRVFGSLLGVRFYQINFWVTCTGAVSLDLLAIWLVQRIKIKDPTSVTGRVN
ncbi:MAG: MFS transporter [Anaerolineaceae bacterium]